MAARSPNRNLGITFRRDGSLIRLAGYLDEFADFAPLLVENPPLKLSLAEVVALNSLGIRRWIAFIREFGHKQIEFHECPQAFIDAANLMPGVVSTNGNMRRIKSVIIPFGCAPCRVSLQRVIATNELQELKGTVSLPSVSCPRCGETLMTEIDPSDHFFFFTYGLPG